MEHDQDDPSHHPSDEPDDWTLYTPAIVDPSHGALKHIHHTTLADLVTSSKDTTEKFCKSMRTCGFACVELPEDVLHSLEDCYEVAKSFLDQPREEKDKWAMKSGADTGYLDMPLVKEYYQMRYCTDVHEGAEWPNHPENFKSSFDAFYHTMRTITKACLRNLALGIGSDPETFLDLLDPEDQLYREDFTSSTIYRFFRYKNLKEHPKEEPCLTHTDIGLFTIIPRSNLSQLLMLHSETMNWINVEELCSRKEAIVFCGETLERLTYYHYRAVIHRVHPCPTGEYRYSLVWLCRARPDAILDSASLESKLIGPIIKEFGSEPPITVSEFMRQKYSSKLSANGLNTKSSDAVGFPGTNIVDDST